MAAQTLGSQHCVSRYRINSKSGVVREGGGDLVVGEGAAARRLAEDRYPVVYELGDVGRRQRCSALPHAVGLPGREGAVRHPKPVSLVSKQGQVGARQQLSLLRSKTFRVSCSRASAAAVSTIGRKLPCGPSGVGAVREGQLGVRNDGFQHGHVPRS